MIDWREVWLLLGSGLLVLLVSFLGSQVVPLYDGVGFPDEPYRYVSPPASGKGAALPPDSPVVEFAPQDGTNHDAIYIKSSELGPQVSINLSNGAVVAPRATQVTLRAQPMIPDTEPADGMIAGNFYRFGGSSDAGAVTLNAAAAQGSVYLRLPQGGTAGPIEYRPAGGVWRQLKTWQTGNDVYRANVAGFGDYALVTLRNGGSASGKKASGQSSGRGLGELMAILLAAVVVMTGVVMAVRLVGRRRKH